MFTRSGVWAFNDCSGPFCAPGLIRDKPGIVVCEVPANPQWCQIGNRVFSWTRRRFPFHTSSAKKLTNREKPIRPNVGRGRFSREKGRQSIPDGSKDRQMLSSQADAS
jgi:hypothetical protein